MKALIQRVSRGSVTVNGEICASIGKGFVILLGVRHGDERESAFFLADKCANLRIFEDAQGKMNLGLREVDGSVLVVSQFTLYAEAQKGNRPGFTLAARPEEAEPLYDLFIGRMRDVLG